jgi:hypothetical protein
LEKGVEGMVEIKEERIKGSSLMIKIKYQQNEKLF